MTAIKVSEATRDQVFAALEAGHLAPVVVFCDYCGIEMETEMIGDTSAERIEGAQQWLRSNRGWAEVDGHDQCMVCVAGIRTCTGPRHEFCNHPDWVWRAGHVGGLFVRPEDLDKFDWVHNQTLGG